MKIYANQLSQHLSRGLQPVYLIFGEEPLQKIEAIDAIRHTAKQAGFEERQAFRFDPQFSWDNLFAEFNSLSLFSSRKIIELEIEKGKPGQAGAKALVELTQVFNPDTILIIHGDKLEASVTKTKWFKTLDALGLYVPVYNIDGSHFNRWLSQRAQQARLRLEPQGISLMAEFYAGNLLAAAQEIDKLAISYADQPISTAYLQSVLLNQSRFNVFQLVDELLLGNIPQAINILISLQHEGVEPTIVNWALSREIIKLFEMKALLDTGLSMSEVCKQYQIWSSRQSLYNNALARLTQAQLEQMIGDLQHIDVKIKSFANFHPYVDFSHICLCFNYPEQLAMFPLSQ